MSLAAQCRQEVLRVHLNFKIGADVPEVAVEGKFGPCVYIFNFCLLSPLQKLLMNASSGFVLTLQTPGVSCHSLELSSR